MNPFSSAVRSAGRLLTSDRDLDVRFLDLPPRMAAGYHFKEPPKYPKPVIDLPRIDITQLNAKQQVRLSALMTHEVKHHDKSLFEAYKKVRGIKALGSLYNCLEDARIELNPDNKSRGAEQDLDEFNADDFAETAEKIGLQQHNCWGWLFSSFFYGLREIGTLPINDDMKKYSDIGWEILDDGRFEKSTKMGRDGGWIILEIAKEMMEKFQEERDEEESDEQSGDGSEKSKEEGSGDGKGSGKTEATPKSIEEEYSKAQGDDESFMPTDKLGQIVASFANPNGKPDFDPIKDERDPFGDYITKTPDYEGDPYIPYTYEDREIIPNSNPTEFNKINSDISVQVSHLKRNIIRMLSDRSQCTVERNLRRGNMDSRQFYKIANGSKRVKMQTDEGISLDAAVTLLIDLSGSMCGNKAELAVKVATVFGEALKGFPQIPFEILGYNSSPLSTEGERKANKCGYVRREIINYWIFKSFKERWSAVRERMGAAALSIDNGGATGGCNCDHENLIHAAARLYDRPESNKIIIVLCDGAPSGYNGTYRGLLRSSLKNTVKRVKASGIKLFCFGIMTDCVKEFYSPDAEIIHSLEDLDKKALMKLTEFLLNT